MKIATILISGALLLAPSLAQAQGANGVLSDKSGRADAVKIPHSSAVSARDENDTDRAIDAELKRINRMMTICTGC